MERQQCKITGAGAVSADKNFSNIPDEVIESLARCILPSIQAYFDSNEGAQAFADWQAEKTKARTMKIKLE